MNREIKFRAWDKATELMIYDVSVSIDKIGFGTDYEIDVALEKKGFSSDDYNLPEYWIDTGEDWFFVTDDYELMQFTGLKDKNGKEIYEGDIVKDKFNTYRIDFSAGAFIMRRLGEREKHKSKHGCYNLSTGIEIIGNIYQNPDLITN